MKEAQRYGTIMSSSRITPEPTEQKADASAAAPAAVSRWSLSDSEGNTRPAYLFPLFLLINVAVMTDRAIVAGASNEFAAFVSSARDSPAFAVESPDAGIGLIQAAFILGYSVAVLLSGHYAHTIRWKPLVLSGLCVWWLGVLGSGNAKDYGSFYVLLFSRMATGCAEAAFQVVAPPLIQDRGGTRSGMWLSFFLTGLPVGLALGYVYGSYMATSDVWDWGWAFYFLNVASLPLLVALAFVKDNTNGGVLSGAGEFEEVARPNAPDDETTERMTDLRSSPDDDHPASNDDGREPLEPLLLREHGQPAATTQIEHRSFTLWSETKVCLSSGVLVSLSLGWAAIMGVVASLGTFGGAYVLALQLFDDEKVRRRSIANLWPDRFPPLPFDSAHLSLSLPSNSPKTQWSSPPPRRSGSRRPRRASLAFRWEGNSLIRSSRDTSALARTAAAQTAAARAWTTRSGTR